MSSAILHNPRIAIVGAGPSGCFLAGALTRALPSAAITVIDRLPCPFGLVRYGVAADHQGTKSITRQFDRIFTREGVTFAGNVRLTHAQTPGAITLTELSARADIVVLATGLSSDRALGIPGENLPGVFGAGKITRLLNSHPDETMTDMLIHEIGEQVSIIGMGNVALDLIRFLAKDAADYRGSDVNDEVLGRYHERPAKHIAVYSRSALAESKCDAAMLRELSLIPGLRVTLHGDTTVAAAPATPELDRTQQARAAELHKLAELTADRPSPRIELRLHFGLRPLEIIGEQRVRSIRFASTQLQATGVESPTFERETDSVISAIGFTTDVHSLALPMTDHAEQNSGRIRPGLYRVGWLRRGPRGTIPENRTDALYVAGLITQDLESESTPIRPEIHVNPLLPEEIAKNSVSYEQWQRIDQFECTNTTSNRARTKVTGVERMLAIARNISPQPALSTALLTPTQ